MGALLAASVALTPSCSKDEAQEFKAVPSDGKLEWYWGYQPTGSNSTFTPVPGVKVKLEIGNEYTSDANGKMTISLPAGDYLYKVESVPGGYSFSPTKIVGDWSKLSVEGGTTTIATKTLISTN
jgi:hypothetical protein